MSLAAPLNPPLGEHEFSFQGQKLLASSSERQKLNNTKCLSTTDSGVAFYLVCDFVTITLVAASARHLNVSLMKMNV